MNVTVTAPLTVWCLLRDQVGHVKPVEQALGPRARFVYDEDWDPERLVRARPDAVVCVNDFHYDVTRCIDAARPAGIPSLVLQDGILEWRCQYENPLFGSGGGAPQHQPVLADRIACIGPQSGRQIAAWGNAGKVEVTGMPRLDHLLARMPPPPRRPAGRMLVMTAKKAGFTPEQQAITLRALEDVRRYLETIPGLEIVWRVDPDIQDRLRVPNALGRFASAELADLIGQVDAVISSPSTAVLEAMVLGRPVAVLDYHNTPRFVGSAWTISAPEHIPSVLAELRDPPARKLAFQRDLLDDCLRLDGPAAPRVGALIERMARGATGAVHPAALGIEAAADSHGAPALAELYPTQPVFTERDVQALQVRLVRLEAEHARLKRQLRLRRRVSGLARRLFERLSRPARESTPRAE